MLRPHSDRLDYGALLMPPEGFRLTQAVATTYSLDLNALISVPVALYFAHSLDVDPGKHLIQLVESIRRAGSQVRVYCQEGQIAAPSKPNRLYAFIEPCITQVPYRENGSFHPKVWVLRYADGKGEVRFRVLVMSRNLTFDRSWDVAFALDGALPANPASPRKQKNRPLADFLSELFRLPEPPEWAETFLGEVAQCEFTLDLEGFTDFHFLPMGFGDYGRAQLFDKVYDELLIISPFLTATGLETARRHCAAKPILFSREEELRKAGPQALKGLEAWHLAGDAVEGESRLESEDGAPMEAIQRQDLHAKVYAYRDGWHAHLALGSTNCSGRGLDRNIEFMLNLSGKDSKVGPKRLFESLVEEEKSLFRRFRPEDAVLTEAEKSQIAIEAKLYALKGRFLLHATLTAKAEIQPDGTYAILCELDARKVKEEPGIEISIHIFPHENQAHTARPGAKEQWAIRNLSALDLSRLAVFRLRHPESGMERLFALKIAMEGLPEGRESRLLRHILENSATFLKYIRFLLAEDPWRDGGNGDADPGKPGSGAWADGAWNEGSLYESLMMAASRSPEKLEDIRGVMDRLAAEGDGAPDLIPEDFRVLWDEFAAFRKANDGKKRG